LAAFLASANRHEAPSIAGWVFPAAVYAIGAAICHQLPERSFHLAAAQLPVCARCAGIYLGAALAAIAAVAPWRVGGGTIRLVGGRARATLTMAVLPTAATLVFEWVTGSRPTNTIRFLAGLPLGAAVAWIVAPAESADVKVN